MSYVKKNMVSMATPYMILENAGRPTNPILSRVLLILERYNWCQIKAYRHIPFFLLSDMLIIKFAYS